MRKNLEMKRILVVDDNDSNLYMIKYLLEKNGFEVIQARTGTEGIKLAIQEKPDLVLMDIQLPDIDGLEATRRIRASEANGKIPIVALTSYAMTGDRKKAQAAGCTGYIAKPIDVVTFIKEIEKYL